MTIDWNAFYEENKDTAPAFYAAMRERRRQAKAEYRKATKAYIAALNALNANPQEEELGDIAATAHKAYMAASKKLIETNEYATEDAPSLKVACREAAEMLEAIQPGGGAAAEARAAIAKAKGAT